MSMICPASRAIKKLLTLPSITRWVLVPAKEPRPYNFVNNFANNFVFARDAKCIEICCFIFKSVCFRKFYQPLKYFFC